MFHHPESLQHFSKLLFLYLARFRIRYQVQDIRQKANLSRNTLYLIPDT